MTSARWSIAACGGCIALVACGDSGSGVAEVDAAVDAALDSQLADSSAMDVEPEAEPVHDSGLAEADAAALGDASTDDAPTDVPLDAPTAETAPEDGPPEAQVDVGTSIPELAPCAISRDVFYVDVEGPQGTVSLGPHTYTDMNATWYASLQPELDVMLLSQAQIQVWMSNSAPPVPGTYPQDSSNKMGPWLEVIIGSSDCGASAGTFALVDLQYDASDASSTSQVTSLALWFDVQCNINTYRGCMRYSK
jgi:hypothetical protein